MPDALERFHGEEKKQEKKSPEVYVTNPEGINPKKKRLVHVGIGNIFRRFGLYHGDRINEEKLARETELVKFEQALDKILASVKTEALRNFESDPDGEEALQKAIEKLLINDSAPEETR